LAFDSAGCAFVVDSRSEPHSVRLGRIAPQIVGLSGASKTGSIFGTLRPTEFAQT
jgi:hypothetical protein